MTNSAETSLLNLNLGSYEGYLRWAYSIPVLGVEEEKALVHAWVEQGDVNAAKKLVYAHLRYVVSVARGFATYGLPMADLVSEGTVGLMKAVKRFDPQHGVRLVTFAMHWVKSEICEYISRNIKLVRVATTHKKARLLRIISKMKQENQGRNIQHQQVHEIANTMDVLPKEVEQMQMHLNHADVSIDDEGAGVELAGSGSTSLIYEDQDWKTKRLQALQKALAQLTQRERLVVASRWLGEDKQTLQELSEQLNVSVERVRQIEAAAIQRLKGLLPRDISLAERT